MIEITVKASSLIKELDHLISQLPTAVDQALQECGELLVQEESQRTKGKLSQSFFTRKEGNQQIVDNSKDYAQYIEFGRGPVTAINAKALRFVVNGQVIFRKSVGPAKAQPFVKQSISAAESKFPSIFDKHIKKLIG